MYHVSYCVFVAFDLCITLMDIGEICQVVTDARFAYGTVGRLDSTDQTSDIVCLLRAIKCGGAACCAFHFVLFLFLFCFPYS